MRFTLTTLLLAFVVVWSSMATFGVAGLVVAAVLLGIAAYVRTAENMGKAIVKVVLILVLIALFFPVSSRAREAARCSQCRNNMKQIGLALHNYHDVYGCFPPAYVPGPDGKPWHSWRVLILPYIEGEALYQQYDFNEPWDGPNNRKLAAQKPYAYGCPSDPGSLGSPTTNYAAVVGPTAAWAGSEPRKLGDFRDPTDSTILVVETAGSGIHWMEPRDLSFDDARTGVHPPGPARVASHHFYDLGYFCHVERGGVNVAMADGSVQFLPDQTSPQALEAMLTIDGGDDPTEWELLPEPQPRPDWPHIVAPIVLVVSYLVLLLRPRRPLPGDSEGRDA
jgi:prepilin-type processing-associated H-X9-DG protein